MFFEDHDTDTNGCIEIGELKVAFKKMQVSDNRAQVELERQQAEATELRKVANARLKMELEMDAAERAGVVSRQARPGRDGSRHDADGAEPQASATDAAAEAVAAAQTTSTPLPGGAGSRGSRRGSAT